MSFITLVAKSNASLSLLLRIVTEAWINTRLSHWKKLQNVTLRHSGCLLSDLHYSHFIYVYVRLPCFLERLICCVILAFLYFIWRKEGRMIQYGLYPDILINGVESQNKDIHYAKSETEYFVLCYKRPFQIYVICITKANELSQPGNMHNWFLSAWTWLNWHAKTILGMVRTKTVHKI